MQKAIYAYIPVVHAGVLSFLDKYPNIPIWILDNEKGREENVYLERDMRALTASQIKQELEALGYSYIDVVNQHELTTRTKTVETLIVPQDEIVEFFLAKYAPSVKVEYDTTFLRWTKQISTTEHEVPQDRVITTDELSNRFLSQLEKQAKKSTDWWRQVAAALVKDGASVTIAHNKHLPSPQSVFINGDPRSNLDAGQGPAIYTSIHAEASAIAQAAQKGITTENSEIFVTTFPCPTCARLIAEAGVKKVFYRNGYSVLDAEDILKSAGVEIILVRENERINQPE